MAKKDLSNKPKNVIVKSATSLHGVKSWFYEEGSGFEIVVEIPMSNHAEYVHLTITWATIMSAVRRYSK